MKPKREQVRQPLTVAAVGQPSVSDRMLMKVSGVASAFEARWTMGSLHRAAPDLRAAVDEQIGLFHAALAGGDERDVVEHGEAMCRGWMAAIIAMEKSGIAEDAIHIGEFGDLVVAIGRAQKCPDWLLERYGAGLVYVRPREVAAMIFQIRQVEEVKRLWPNAEIVEVRAKEKSDAV